MTKLRQRSYKKSYSQRQYALTAAMAQRGKLRREQMLLIAQLRLFAVDHNDEDDLDRMQLMLMADYYKTMYEPNLMILQHEKRKKFTIDEVTPFQCKHDYRITDKRNMRRLYECLLIPDDFVQ